MKRRNKKKPREMRVIRLWTLPQADKALPYLRSVTGSLREHWLESQGKKQALRRLAARPGRPDRQALLAHQGAVQEQTEAEDRFGEALQELMKIDVYLLDPVQGLAFIPFNHGEELAWFVFDRFDQEGLKNWRLHTDPLETRRPVSELLADPKINPANN